MFDLLKSKMKSLFSKAKGLRNIYENENTVDQHPPYIKKLGINEDRSNI